MADTTLKIDDSILQDVVQAAMLQMMTEEARTTIITDAIERLTARPPKTTYDTSPRSPLEQAWEIGLMKVANQVVTEMLSEETLLEHVKEGMRVAMEKIAKEEYLADAIGSAISARISDKIRERY